MRSKYMHAFNICSSKNVEPLTNKENEKKSWQHLLLACMTQTMLHYIYLFRQVHVRAAQALQTGHADRV